MANHLSAIKHVVQIMLENRSFDQMLGFLYPGRADFDGLKGNEECDGVTPTAQPPQPGIDVNEPARSIVSRMKRRSAPALSFTL